MELSKQQRELVVSLVGSVVALEEAEKVFDTSSKSIITMFKEVYATVDKVEGTAKVRASLVAIELIKVVESVYDVPTTVISRVKKVITTVEALYLSGITLKVTLIPFTLIQKVVELHSGQYISKSSITKAKKVDDSEYKKAIEDICTAGAYKELVGAVDYSMLDESLVTLVKELDSSAITGLAGLCKIVVGASKAQGIGA